MPETIGNKWDLDISTYNENFRLIETVTIGPSHRSAEDFALKIIDGKKLDSE